ncbi:hypothetical protein ARMSODRAFT_345750 [Armillaria solidipes]|uniref:Uncharacterized protein n=1 Tax=Armillaria solidipes TaxID=1076256 RepID=A0A2H3BQG6_9AGAR|nr:hypothetical protein ARMSODRAFT_345750 [Armillaria solidipes]
MLPEVEKRDAPEPLQVALLHNRQAPYDGRLIRSGSSIARCLACCDDLFAGLGMEKSSWGRSMIELRRYHALMLRPVARVAV